VTTLRQLADISIRSLVLARRQARAKAQANKVFQRYVASHSTRKLHIGAGGILLDGWLNVDIAPLSPQVSYLDAAAPYPIVESTFDYVYSEHVFEHLDLPQQRRMLAEVYRVLRPGGTIRMATPDFDVLIALTTEEKPFLTEYRRWSAQTYYPDQLAALGDSAYAAVFVINNYFYNWGHRFIHNSFSLRTLLENAGFHNVRKVAVAESADPELQGLERHGTVIPTIYNTHETMVFEATR
jgi:SAM-dependent methyltransferase